MADWAEWWRRTSPRERLGVVMLAAAALGFLGYRLVFQGQARQLDRGRAEWLALRQQVQVLRAALPDVEQERQRLPVLAAENEALEEALDQMQRTLITSGELTRLIGALTTRGDGLQVTFDAIKQHVREQADRPEATIDVVMTAPYQGVVNYLRRVEALSPFLRVAKLEIAEPKDRAQASSRAAIMFVTPLAPTSEPGGLAHAMAIPPLLLLTIARDPFGSPHRVAAAATSLDLKVTGILWRGAGSTAIVNGEVVRVGDMVDALVIRQILPDKVIVADGAETHELLLETPQ